MDSKRLKELAGVVAEATEQEKALEAVAVTEEKVLEEDVKDAGLEQCTDKEVIEENMFQGGYGAEKSQEGQVVAELAQMLRDIKVFIRDGNMEDAAMMVDRAYSRAAGAKRA